MPEHEQTLPQHVQWLVANAGAALQSVLDQQAAGLYVVDALHILVDADPSPGSHGVDWLYNALLRGGMRWEDVRTGHDSRAARTLADFALHRRALPAGKRNLKDYAGLGNLHAALAPLLQEPTTRDPAGRALRRQARARAHEQSLVLCARPDLVVAVPLSQEASCWWGRGTQWCTAADQDNMFAYYNKKAPLIVVCMPAIPGGKLQIHVDHDDEYSGVQFMDVHDAPVEPSYIEQHWDRLAPVVEWLALNHFQGIHWVPPAKRAPELLRRVVQAHPWALHEIREEERTSQVCWAAFDANPTVFEIIPDMFRTPQMCAQLVARRPDLLGSVPHARQTRAMCLDAVKAHGLALRGAAAGYRDHALCLAAVESNARALEYVPDHLVTPELCAVGMKGAGASLDHVPPSYRKAGICWDAVEQVGANLGFVPHNLRTAPLCALAVQRNGAAIVHVPHGLRTRELYVTALMTYGTALASVPCEYLTREMCTQAVSICDTALQHVPQHLLDASIVEHALACHPLAVKFAPRNLLTHELLTRAMTAEPGLIHSSLASMVDDRVLLAMLASNGMALRYIQRHRISLQMCRIAVTNDPDAIAYVPPSLVNELVELMGVKPVPTPGWLPETALADLVSHLQAHPGQVRVEGAGIEHIDASPLGHMPDIDSPVDKNGFAG